MSDVKMEQRVWRCFGCNTIIGFVENDQIIRIKRKDLYVETEGGRVKVMCYKCGKPNELIDDTYKNKEKGGIN